MKKISLLIALILLSGCERKEEYMKKHHVVQNPPIIQYNTNDDGFVYILYTAMDNSCPCYTYNSPTQVQRFDTVNFNRVQTTSSLPSNISNPTRVGTSINLSKENQKEVEQDEEQAEGTTEETVSDASENVESAPNTSDTSSNTDSSASGGDSGGGGDGGGGGD